MALVAGRMPTIHHPLDRNHYGEDIGMQGILKSGTSQRPSREVNPYRSVENQRNEDGKRLVRFCENNDNENYDTSSRESVVDDESQDVIMFGSNMYFINKSDPNSAVRKLFPNSKLTPINPFINRSSSRESNIHHLQSTKAYESNRNILNRSKTSEVSNRNILSPNRRKIVDQNNPRRNLSKMLSETKQKQGRVAESSTPLIERIKQLTCENEETHEDKKLKENKSKSVSKPGNLTKFENNTELLFRQTQRPKDLPKKAKEGLNLMRYNELISQTRSLESTENRLFSPIKTSPTEEARRSFMSSLSQSNEQKSDDRNSVASNSTNGDTVYSLSDIEEALTDEEKEIKEAFAQENKQDELELFVQQDAGRTERLRKRYSSTPKPENHIPTLFSNTSPTQKNSSSTNLNYVLNGSNNLKKEKPKFGSTIEILQQLQQQIETPYQLEGRRTACSNYSDCSIPISERLFCDESSDGYEPVIPKQNVHRTCSLDSKNYEEIDNFPSAFSVPRTKSHEHPRLIEIESDPYFYAPSFARYPGNFAGRNQRLERNVYASSPDLHGYQHTVFPDRVSSYNSRPSGPRQLHPVLQRQYCRYPVNETSRPADEGKILTPPIRMHTYMNVPATSPPYPPPPPYSKVNSYLNYSHHDCYPYKTPPLHSNIYQNIPLPTNPHMMAISCLYTERERGIPEGASSCHDSDELFPQNEFYYNTNVATVPKPSSLPYHYCVDV